MSFFKFIDKTILQQPVESNIDEQIQLPPDHGLPVDPSKWTVSIRFLLDKKVCNVCFCDRFRKWANSLYV
jgi:hypothetical protein